MITERASEGLSRIFKAICTPTRVQILGAIGKGEACVCHLEAVLNLRQAYISQQLMEMRDADLVDTRREGRYIFYRVTEPRILDLLFEIGTLFGIPLKANDELNEPGILPDCCCPHCEAAQG